MSDIRNTVIGIRQEEAKHVSFKQFWYAIFFPANKFFYMRISHIYKFIVERCFFRRIS